MTEKKIVQLLRERERDKIISHRQGEIEGADILFLTSSSDLGVCRNGGRRGARFAPQGILASLNKMVSPLQMGQYSVREVASREGEEENFVEAQKSSGEAIKKIVTSFKGNTIIHLGGGHDHIFPLLYSYFHLPSIHVINIDAHLDTRDDPLPLSHSGTPFRQVANLYRGKFRLTQIGIHPFANPLSAQQNLNNIEMEIISAHGATSFEQLKEKLTYCEEELTILSLDCDAMASSTMEAVSAVNPMGLSHSIVADIFSHYHNLPQGQKIYGIYEYNPLFDNLSAKGAASIASLIYQGL